MTENQARAATARQNAKHDGEPRIRRTYTRDDGATLRVFFANLQAPHDFWDFPAEALLTLMREAKGAA